MANFDEYGLPGAAPFAFSGRWLLQDPGGYWEGPWTGFWDAVDRCRGTVVLTGRVAYESLYAVLAEKPEQDLSGGSIQVVEGVILVGEMPPLSEPPGPAQQPIAPPRLPAALIAPALRPQTPPRGST